MANDKEIIEWFRASTAYINSHRGKTFVVFLSGEALAHDNLPNIIFDLSLLHSLGVRLVIVHGSRPQITEALDKAGISSEYSNNLRITEAKSLETVTATVGKLSAQIEALFSMGLRDSPMHGSNINVCRGNFVTGKPVGVLDGVDYQFTGKIRKVQATAIQQQLDAGNIVLLSNLGYSVTGEIFNLSAEEVVTETAVAVNAEKLLLLVPTPGVMSSTNELVPALTEDDGKQYADELQQRGDDESLSVSRALRAALRVNANAVHRSHLISYKENGAMLLELFTRDGHGSLLSRDSRDRLRDATIEDVGGILNLIKPLEEAGTLVARSRELLENEIANFIVVELEETIIACAALYPVSAQAGEVACIAIHPNYQNNGLGKRLLESLEKHAQAKAMSSLFTLTTEASHFFLENGYKEVSVDTLPSQRQQLYNLQRKSKVLLKKLD
ncbi:MAG: amino-acid N-acetyltransferase [Pseudomonadales bacterium]|nr:amino-acid N-acetyltransferase [Pseudomonadales bacterium]